MMMMMMMMITIIIHMSSVHASNYPAPAVFRPMRFDLRRCKRFNKSKPSNIRQLQMNSNFLNDFEQQNELVTLFLWTPGFIFWILRIRSWTMIPSETSGANWSESLGGLLTRVAPGMSFSETIQARNS